MLRSIGGSVVLYPRYDNSSLNYHQVMFLPKNKNSHFFFCGARRHGAYVGRTGGQICARALCCYWMYSCHTGITFISYTCSAVNWHVFGTQCSVVLSVQPIQLRWLLVACP